MVTTLTGAEAQRVTAAYAEAVRPWRIAGWLLVAVLAAALVAVGMHVAVSWYELHEIARVMEPLAREAAR